MATEAELEQIHQQVDAEVQTAADIALASPQPGSDTIYKYVYSPDVDPTSEQFDTEDDPHFTGEPTTMVDPLMSTHLAGLMLKLKQQLKLTSVVVTRDLGLADFGGEMALPDRVAAELLAHEHLEENFADRLDRGVELTRSRGFDQVDEGKRAAVDDGDFRPVDDDVDDAAVEGFTG